jgi:hypothetical protein
MTNSETQSPHYTDKVKYLYFAADPEINEIEYYPHFYAEVRIDFNDVRTGLSERFSLYKAMEIHAPNADLIWIMDMVQDVDPLKISAAAPEFAHFRKLPDYVDASFISQMETQFIQYLLRSFVTEIYRNSSLNVYSISKESQSEFIGRCMDLFEGSMRRELDLLQDVFIRRLEQLKEKYLVSDESLALEQARIESHNKDIFSRYAERIAELFLRSRFGLGRAVEPFQSSPGMPELEERLAALGIEAQNAIANLNNSYKERAHALDKYILHPNLKDIHFVRSCILWMPKQAV